MSYVLVIDDDAWQADMLVGQLTKDGFAAEAVPDALAAFDSIDARRPEAIVLDIMLPGPNGIAFLHELRSHMDIADIPVVVCTAQHIELSALRPYGVTAVLAKETMHPDDIVVAIRKALA